MTISALHPGVVNTALWRELWGPIKYVVYGVGALFLKSPAQGAATTVWAATEDTLEGVGGKYYADRREAAASRQVPPRHVTPGGHMMRRHATHCRPLSSPLSLSRLAMSKRRRSCGACRSNWLGSTLKKTNEPRTKRDECK